MRKALLLSALFLTAAFGINPEIRNVKTVYLLRMVGGLDQFLASELTKHGLFLVTTDAQRADAVLTDSLGEEFEKKWKDLYPPPPPPDQPEKEETEEQRPAIPNLTEAPNQRAGHSSWGRGKGTVFVVDRNTRSILWSMNRQTKGTSAQEMTTQAQKMVDQLKKDIQQLEKQQQQQQQQQ